MNSRRGRRLPSLFFLSPSMRSMLASSSPGTPQLWTDKQEVTYWTPTHRPQRWWKTIWSMIYLWHTVQLLRPFHDGLFHQFIMVFIFCFALCFLKLRPRVSPGTLLEKLRNGHDMKLWLQRKMDHLYFLNVNVAASKTVMEISVNGMHVSLYHLPSTSFSDRFDIWANLASVPHHVHIFELVCPLRNEFPALLEAAHSAAVSAGCWGGFLLTGALAWIVATLRTHGHRGHTALYHSAAATLGLRNRDHRITRS